MQLLRRRPFLADSLLAGVFVVLAQVEVILGLTTREPWIHAVVAPVLLVPLAFRRRYPVIALAAAMTGLGLLDPEALLSFFGPVIIASYSVGAHTEAPRTYLGPAIAMVPFVVLAAQGTSAPSDFVAFAAFFGGPWFVGRLVRQRVAQADELVRLAELERERETASAVEAERARIARELHDIVSHEISVVTVQTQAVRRRLAPDQEREADDLRAVEATAREAMAEMRRLFGVLRVEGAPASLAPQPGLDQLDRLVEQTRAAGLDVEVAEDGARVPLPPGVDLAAYRIVQEALTNARRHAAWPDGCRAPPLGRVGARARDRGRRDRHRVAERRRARVDRDAGASHPLRRRARRRRARGGRIPGAGAAALPRGGDVSIRVVVADDQGMVRAGLRSLLEEEPDIEVVGEAADGEEAVRAIRRLRPDVALMDIRMPNLDGIAATRALVEEGAAARVLILTTFDLDEYVFEPPRAGASC